MRKSVKNARVRAVLLAGMLAIGFQVVSLDAIAKKDKPVEGVSDVFKGIGTEDQVKMNDPLWERYAYAGKRALERSDISLAQQYYWASYFELEDLANLNQSSQFSDETKRVLSTMVSLSNDVFFQDADSAKIRDTPQAFPQPILPEEQKRVDSTMTAINDAQKAFDAKHPSFDGGARLRMIHLRRRLDFSTKMLPLMKKFFGTDDGITRIVNQAYASDNDELKDMESGG